MSPNITEKLDKFKTRGILILTDDSVDKGRGVMVAVGRDIKHTVLNEVLTLARGHLYVVMSPDRVAAFGLSRMELTRRFSVSPDTDLRDHCVSVEAREGITTGISIADRCTTISALAEDTPDKRKIISPGHVFPIEARKGGVLVKNSLKEASLDVVRSIGTSDAAVMVDLLDDSGELLSEEGQINLGRSKDIPVITLSEVIRYRLQHERIVERVAQTVIPNRTTGTLKAYIFQSNLHGGEHLALVKGEIDPEKAVLTRVQTENTFSDVFGGGDGLSRDLIQKSLAAIAQEESGVLLYLRKIDSGHLSHQIGGQVGSRGDNKGLAPERMKEYGLGAQILLDLGVKKIKLLTNSKNKLVGLNTFGIEIVETQMIN